MRTPPLLIFQTFASRDARIDIETPRIVRLWPRGNKMTPDYGIDAPGVRRGMLLAGVAGAILAGLAVAATFATKGTLSTVALVVATGAVLLALYGFGMGGYMTWASRVGKLRTREKLLDLVNDLAPWTGQENILDVGCGRGLLLVGAARRLTTGTAVGIDIWRNEDQSANTPQAPLDNALFEGVAGRVSVQTGDARDLPFPPASFDVVMSHWVVHNIKPTADGERALDEMFRVLRPGGVLMLADIANHEAYRARISNHDFDEVRVETGGLEARILGALSGGSFKPQAIVARRQRA